MTGPVDPDRDQLIEVAARTVGTLAPVVVDALLPVLASMRQQWQQEGRNQAAEAIEADWIGLARSAVAPVLDRLDVVAHNPIQGEAMHKVIGWEVANAAAALARGGSTDEERNDEQ